MTASLLSLMAQETREAPAVAARLLEREALLFETIGRRLRSFSPPVVVTCGRGSSDHAAHFFKYALEITLGVPVASLGPSLASIYDAPLRLRGAAMLTVSQSGQSPDIVALQQAARAAGALTIAIVNVAESPVAKGADFFVPMHAGPEHSVAATKTLIASAVACAAIVAAWTGDPLLGKAVRDLPRALERALEQDWSAGDALASAASLFVVGRGPALPMAQEAALKMKETARLHAEAFSVAEVMHGPMQLVQSGFPVLAFVPDDRAAEATRTAIGKLAGAGATVFSASALDMPGIRLPTARTGHGVTDPIAMIQSFYGLAERIARLRGQDPDRPVNLRKVTQTV